MKISAIPRDTNIKKRFFLLMIVPLLIGLIISLTSFAHAKWDTQADPLLHKSPAKDQGWTEVQTHRVSSTDQKVEQNS